MLILLRDSPSLFIKNKQSHDFDLSCNPFLAVSHYVHSLLFFFLFAGMPWLIAKQKCCNTAFIALVPMLYVNECFLFILFNVYVFKFFTTFLLSHLSAIKHVYIQ